MIWSSVSLLVHVTRTFSTVHYRHSPWPLAAWNSTDVGNVQNSFRLIHLLRSSLRIMGQTSSRIDSNAPTKASPPGCPVPHAASTTPADIAQPAKCPIDHTPSTKAAQCPIDHDAVNPLNQMPSLSQTPSQSQNVQLPTNRIESSIPRDEGSKWEYPSPQQFYNALVRKGWETPEEHVVTMVEIHNFLNEEAWEEVRKWERRHNWYESRTSSQSVAVLTSLLVMKASDSPVLKAAQESSRQRHGSGCLLDGFYHLDSSQFIVFLKTPRYKKAYTRFWLFTLLSPVPNHPLIDMIG